MTNCRCESAVGVLKITNPRKILFPDDGVTKEELVTYYRRIASWMLPHVRGRPVAVERYPDGIDKPGFFQKDAASYFPGWIKTATVEKKTGGVVRHVVCDDAATLVYLASQACVTPHVWLSRIDKLTHPDQMVFDLDSSGSSFDMVKSTAESLKAVLDELELPAFVKTTGSRGLHVAVPLRRTEPFPFDAVRDFARELATVVVSQAPRQRTLELVKSKRRGRVFVDTNRIAYAQTMAPAYAVRARRGAPVSLPLDWNELQERDLRPDGTTIRNVFDRLETTGDPWHDFWRHGVSLNGPCARFEALVSLEAYRKKRDFAQTPEPPGDVRRAARRRKPIFVVQKHDASRLHYDFRLEINGVLTSWAVPKGPSMNPADKRLAVMTEDHPLEYADFEGIIPKGQYGAGTVMIWDKGWYELAGDASAERQLARGKIDMVLHGRKLRGGFTLVRTANRSSGRSQASNWLLVKHRDEYADSSWSIEAPPLNRSLLTGRTLDEIAHGAAHKHQRTDR